MTVNFFWFCDDLFASKSNIADFNIIHSLLFAFIQYIFGRFFPYLFIIIWMGLGVDFWQNVVHWRREWQTTSAFLPWELHERMKSQKDRTMKDELPRSVGAQYATGDQWRNNPERIKRWSQSKNNTQLWMWLVMEVKSDAIKSNIS